MNRNVRVISILLLLTMLVACFAGCGKDKEEETTTATETTSVTTAAETTTAKAAAKTTAAAITTQKTTAPSEDDTITWCCVNCRKVNTLDLSSGKDGYCDCGKVKLVNCNHPYEESLENGNTYVWFESSADYDLNNITY